MIKGSSFCFASFDGGMILFKFRDVHGRTHDIGPHFVMGCLLGRIALRVGVLLGIQIPSDTICYALVNLAPPRANHPQGGTSNATSINSRHCVHMAVLARAKRHRILSRHMSYRWCSDNGLPMLTQSPIKSSLQDTSRSNAVAPPRQP